MRDEDTNMRNNDERTKEKVGNRKEKAWKIIYQNIRGIVTNNREKLSIFYEEGRLDKIIMNFTESWLNSETKVCPEMGG